MSNWTDFRDKESSQKITLVEIDLPEWQTFWLPAEAGIWKFKLVDAHKGVIYNFQNGLFTQGSFQNSGKEDLGLNASSKQVGSFEASGESYTEASDFATLRSTNKSFFYDDDTILYVHFDNWDPPSVFSPVIIGIIYGFSTKEMYFSDDLYEGRIKSVPAITVEKDPLYFGLIYFGGGTITLHNEDSRFDSWDAEYVFGQAARIKFGGDDLALADYYTVFTGCIDNFQINSEEITIDLVDNRKLFSRNLPIHVFDLSTYPNIKSNNANKPIPIVYGTVANASIMCIDEDAGSAEATYNFLICDVADHSAGIKAINQIYIDKRDGKVAASAVSYSLTAATFVLSGGSAVTKYEPGDTVTADIEGYTSGGAIIGNGLHIITDILGTYLSKPYNSDIYDTTEWVSSQTAAYNCGLWLDERKTIADIIEEISVSIFGSFIVNPDGKYTFRMTDNDRATAKTITRSAQLTQPAADWKTEEFLSSVIIKYNKDQEEGNYLEYPDMSRQTTVFNKYSKYQEQEFETLLTNITAASALAASILDLTDEIVPTFEVVTKTQNIDIKLLDNVIAQIDRVQSVWLGNTRCEVTGITYNLDEYTVSMRCRYIEDA